jgi:hypothetical protein
MFFRLNKYNQLISKFEISISQVVFTKYLLEIILFTLFKDLKFNLLLNCGDI